MISFIIHRSRHSVPSNATKIILSRVESLWPSPLQNALLTRKVMFKSRVGKLVERANKKLEDEVEAIRKQKLSESVVGITLKFCWRPCLSS